MSPDPGFDPTPTVRPQTLAASAAELEWLTARLGEAVNELNRLTASGELGARATQHCASVITAMESAFATAGGLAHDLRRAAEHGESVLAELARAVLRAGGELAGSTPDALRRVLKGTGQHGSEVQWCPADTGCADHPINPEAWLGWSAPATPAPRPGDGPMIGGTDGQRPDTSLGVRIAQLPDA